MARRGKAKTIDKMKATVVEYLLPGEQIQAVFPAQTKSPYVALLLAWNVVFSKASLTFKSTRPKNRVVVVTDRRIFVVEAGTWRPFAVKKILRELPRLTKIGPAKGLWYRTEALGEPLYIHRGYHEDVAFADS